MKYNIKKWFYIILSFAAVAWAQPDLSRIACIIASALGIALFWRGMLYFESKAARFWLATLWWGGVSGVHLSWLAADRYVGLYIFIFLALLLFCLGVQFALVSLLVKEKMSVLRILTLASLGTLFEWARLFVLSGYSFDPLGLALTAYTASLQLSTIFGVYGLTFWILMTNGLGVNLLTTPFKLRALFSWGFIALVPYFFGWGHLAYHQKKMEEEKPAPLSVVLVQTALSPEEKAALSGSSGKSLSPLEQWKRIFVLLKEHLGKEVDIIVLSESALPYGADLPLYYSESIKNVFLTVFGEVPTLQYQPNDKMGNAEVAKLLANFFEAKVVIGLEKGESIAYSQEYRAYNSGYVFYATEKPADRYDKQVLVPMGEYIPFAWCKKFLRRYGICDSFTRGEGAKVFAQKTTPLALSICYEETFGHLMRENKKKGASLLINLTNDAWYPHSRLAVVHYLHGRPRTVENGIPLLRSCNTGVTCGVDSLGRVLAALPHESKHQQSEARALHFNLPTYTYSTVYTTLGDHLIVGASCSFASLFFLLWYIKRKKG